MPPMPGDFARLSSLAAAHSMSVTRDETRVVATRVGPGFPRRLVVTVAQPATEDDWDAAARLLASEISASATPDAC